jgi:hypothetical protein
VNPKNLLLVGGHAAPGQTYLPPNSMNNAGNRSTA